MHEHVPIERFLGPIDTTTGAFGLLGLSPRPVTDQEIDAALARMIARIQAHRQGSSAEAHEVVLALHVAAAQLRDPHVQRAMLAQLPVRATPEPELTPAPIPLELEPDAPGPARGPIPAAARPAPPMVGVPAPMGGGKNRSPQGFRELAMYSLAHAGGWNAESRRRIAGIAHTLGLGTADVRAALAEVAEVSRARSLGVVMPAVEAPESELAVVDGPPAPRWLVIATLATFLLAGVLAIVLVTILFHRLPAPSFLTRSSPPAPVLPVPKATARATPAPPVVKALDPADEPVVEDHELTGTLATLRRAATLLPTDPAEAIRLANGAIASTGADWISADPVVVGSIVSEVSSFLALASKSETSVVVGVASRITEMASQEPGASPRGLREVVFATGLAARLSRDATASSAESGFRSLLAAHSGDGSGVKVASFGAGAGLALTRMMSGCAECPDMARIAPDWVRVYRGLRSIDADAAETALLDSVGSVLAQPLTESTSAAIRALVPELSFGDPGSRTAVRVIGWFEDRRIPMGAISVFASELISSGALPGAPLDVAVSASGSEADRLRVRDVLASRLGVPLTAPNQRIAERLQSEARALLKIPTPKDPREALELAARAAIVHQGAALKWVGRDAEAEEILATATQAGLGQRIAAEMGGLEGRLDLARLTGPASETDGQWALRYVQAAHNEDDRARLLADLRSATISLGPADADMLAIAALGPNPPLLRKTAQRTLLMHATNPFVLAAVSEMIPESVATDDVADTLEGLTMAPLPDVNSEGFRAAAARAVLERLLSALAPSIDRQVAALHEVFADAYMGISRAGTTMDLEDSFAGRPQSAGSLELDRTATTIRASLRRDAQRYAEGRWTFVPLAELDRRFAARAMLPRTGLERFVVDQLALAEMLAYLVSAERPVVSGEVQRIVTEMEREHLEATHPYLQILSAERCIVRLWTLRFGAESPVAAGGAG